MAAFKKKTNKKEEKDLSYKDLYLRVSADLQNYERRVEKERARWIVEAKAEVLVPLLSTLDDVGRAVDFCRGQSDASKGLLEGLELVQKNLEKTFADLGVTEIDCSGQFDPDLHEALIEVESPDHTSGEIVEVVSKGYMFDSQVLRHAKVSVAK